MPNGLAHETGSAVADRNDAGLTVLPSATTPTREDRPCDGCHADYPWRCPEEHRPLGNLMRMRKEVYRQSSILRHALNHQIRREPENLAEVFGKVPA
jgi:hypothetical protein